MPIQILPQEVVQKIAAGEVIERPASVVKELIENALDAGATEISVQISDGGLSEIRVADNGCGIPRSEIELAFTSHATSKMSSLEDLDRLSTLGFRGEALASIAVVADVSLTTCHKTEQVGTKAHFVFGKKRQVLQEARGTGTTVSVRDLFANVPARRKFLRKPTTEGQSVISLVSRYAIAHSQVSFRLQADGRQVLQTVGSDLLDAIRRVQGPEIGDALLPFDFSEAGLRAYGYASPPSLHRAAARYVDIFVNGRWIQDRLLSRAVAEAYRSLLPSGRFPVVYLLMEVPPAKLDVNVHPAKSEVRFAEPERVFQIAFRAVRSAISDSSLVPSLVPIEAGSGSGTGQQSQQAIFHLGSLVPQPSALAQPAITRPSSISALPPLRAVGQIQQTYIVAEGPDGLYLIDQHAAHERVLFERFLQERSSGPAIVQGLIPPLPVSLGATRCSQLAKVSAKLQELGFDIEPFGPDVVLARSVPAMLAQRGAPLESALLDVFDSLANGDEDRWLEHTLVRLVCHSAIRAGETLDLAQMREILRALENTGTPRTCPHGRPTMLYLSASQVEREFRRR
ncbi:MAG: DNA mismatch repair endonuclease MutL [Anaerolineae bacterium]